MLFYTYKYNALEKQELPMPLQVTLYYFPRRGPGHVAASVCDPNASRDTLHSSEQYITWGGRESYQADKEFYGEAILIPLPIIDKDYNAFLSSHKDALYFLPSSKAYRLLENNCAHAIEQLLFDAGYLKEKPEKKTGRRPYSVTRNACKVAQQHLRLIRDKKIIDAKATMTDLIDAKITILELQKNRELSSHLPKKLAQFVNEIKVLNLLSQQLKNATGDLKDQLSLFLLQVENIQMGDSTQDMLLQSLGKALRLVDKEENQILLLLSIKECIDSYSKKNIRTETPDDIIENREELYSYCFEKKDFTWIKMDLDAFIRKREKEDAAKPEKTKKVTYFFSPSEGEVSAHKESHALRARRDHKEALVDALKREDHGELKNLLQDSAIKPFEKGISKRYAKILRPLQAAIDAAAAPKLVHG